MCNIVYYGYAYGYIMVLDVMNVSGVVIPGDPQDKPYVIQQHSVTEFKLQTKRNLANERQKEISITDEERCNYK